MDEEPHTTTHRENVQRLARIEGQVRGIRRMIDEGKYCIDIITQIQAVRSALGAVETRILHKHVGHCVSDALSSKSEEEAEEKLQELLKVIKRGTS